MSSIRGYNKLIAVEVPPPQVVDRKITSGVATTTTRNVLVALKVVYGNGFDIQPGDVVYVNSALVYNQKWSTEVYDWSVGSIQNRFCMLPEANIAMVAHQERSGL